MINLIKETGKDFSDFLKQPADKQDSIQTGKRRTRVFFSLLVIDLLLMLAITPVISMVDTMGWVNMDNHATTKLIAQFPLWQVFVLAVLIGPLIEEIIFRFFLRYRRNFLIHFIISLSSPKRRDSVESFFERYWSLGFPVIFYVSAVLFALIHLSNFEYSPSIWLFAPVLVAPQFIAGLINGYIRVKYNFMLGYSMHAAHNLIFVGIGLLFMGEYINKLDVKNEEYALKIEEPTRYSNDETSILHSSSPQADSIHIQGESIETIVAFLLDKDVSFIESGRREITDTKVNLSFKRLSDYEADNKSLVLQQLGKVYGFDIESAPRRHEVWELTVVDSLLLRQFQSDAIEGANRVSKVTTEEIRVENINLAEAAKLLTSVYKNQVVDNTGTSQQFNFAFARSEFAELPNLLMSEYGLGLQQKEQESEYITIRFHSSR
jgi:uncharacterized protein (TIGR03435 family)